MTTLLPFPPSYIGGEDTWRSHLGHSNGSCVLKTASPNGLDHLSMYWAFLGVFVMAA